MDKTATGNGSTEIWKAQSYTAWSVYTNGKYLDYI